MTLLDDFALAVRSYCDWATIPAENAAAKLEMLTARRHLSSLFALAANLPTFECDWMDRRPTDVEWAKRYRRFGKLPVGYYGSICDPLQVPAGEAALGDLADDLADIWRDLQAGLTLFEEGHRNAAGWQWLDSFTIHWGEHASNAIAVIHFWIGRHQYRD